MSEVVLLSDTTLSAEVGNSRYMGPYAVAAAARKAGTSTVVIDYFTRHPDFFTYIESFLTSETLAVGISSTFLSPVSGFVHNRKQRKDDLKSYYRGDLWFDDPADFKAWFSKLKELMNRRSPRAKLVLGGVKSQFAIFRSELYSVFDYVILGAAEQTFTHLVDALRRGESIPCKNINGILFVANDLDVQNKGCPEAEWGFRDGVQSGESLPLEIARGCVFNCKFCHHEKKESFKKELETLKLEIQRNYERFGTTVYYFCDDCFNDHPKKVEAICGALLELPFKIQWVSYARVDVAVKFPHTIDLMVESGARGLYWGLESFDGDVARRAGKGTPPDKVKAFLIDFHKKYGHRCMMEGSFITGLPGETDQSLQSTMDWLCENPVLDLITVGTLGLMPYVSRLDQKVFDYAEYSRNPEKFGFKKVQFNPLYWEHETMNIHQADEWAEKITSAYQLARPSGFLRSIWQYPHLRSLGYTENEIFAMSRPTGQSREELFDEVSGRFNRFVRGYWDLLSEQNSK